MNYTELIDEKASYFQGLAQSHSGNFLEALDKAKAGERLTPLDIILLLNCSSDSEKRSVIIHTANEVKEVFYGKRIKRIIPLIISNICVNQCRYCGYGKGSKISRRRLDSEAFQQEFDYVFNMGYRNIELVLAEDPKFPPERLAEYVRYAATKVETTGVGGISINLAPLDINGYQELKEAGISGVYMWQESYDPEAYRKYHPTNTPKGDFLNRLDSYERMIKAGIKSYGVGVLLGLGDPRYEVLSIIEHCNFLEQEYGLMPSMFGIPRMQKSPYAKDSTAAYPMDDDLFRTIVAIYRLVFPATNIFVNSRETIEMQKKLIRGGGDVIVLECSTYPGGYTTTTRLGQFKHHRFKSELEIPKLAKEGYEVVNDYDDNHDPALREKLKTRQG